MNSLTHVSWRCKGLHYINRTANRRVLNRKIPDAVQIASGTAFALELLMRLRWDKDRANLGRWMRRRGEEMGPLQVKLMQFASIRSDGLDEEILVELRKLQDDVTPFDCFEYESILNLYGATSAAPPIACGSIAAVFKGMHEGAPVAIKVKRPGIAEEFMRTLKHVEAMCKFLRLMNIAGGGNMEEMIQECRPVIMRETDFLNEANNAYMMQDIFSDVDWVRIPKIIRAEPDYLVMEYVPGIKSDNVKAVSEVVNPSIVAIRLAASFSLQVLRFGIFHADPHPGNIAFSDEGKLILYDFGAVLALDASPRFHL
jgi:predicted unusual protein kinase regulating ubiquinone biosynthesis (AarF/ABC1/UbiB family)